MVEHLQIRLKIQQFFSIHIFIFYTILPILLRSVLMLKSSNSSTSMLLQQEKLVRNIREWHSLERNPEYFWMTKVSSDILLLLFILISFSLWVYFFFFSQSMFIETFLSFKETITKSIYFGDFYREFNLEWPVFFTCCSLFSSRELNLSTAIAALTALLHLNGQHWSSAIKSNLPNRTEASWKGKIGSSQLRQVNGKSIKFTVAINYNASNDLIIAHFPFDPCYQTDFSLKCSKLFREK